MTDPTPDQIEQQNLKDLFDEGIPVNEEKFNQIFHDETNTQEKSAGSRIPWSEIATGHGFESEGGMFRQWYVVEKRSLREIASKVGGSHVAVRNKLKLCGIPLRERGGRGRRKQYEIQELLDSCGYTLPDLMKKFKNLNRVAEALGVPYGKLYRLFKEMEGECEPVESVTDSPTE